MVLTTSKKIYSIMHAFVYIIGIVMFIYISEMNDSNDTRDGREE